jgi:phage major head subunit gpT-like protein
MRTITLRDYDRLLAHQWWPSVMKEGPKSESKKERVNWMLDTARIKNTGKGGYIPFEDMVSQTSEVEMQSAASGLKMFRNQLEDLDGNGLDWATNWSRGVGEYAAYWPQKQLADAIKSNPVTYDGKAFFAKDHPVNPFKTSAGIYANLFSGSAGSGAQSPTNLGAAYPGSIKIDTSVSLEDAVVNLAKAIAYVSSMRMANGEDPRNLRLAALIVPPALMVRATQITNAKMIATVANVAGTVGGMTDMEAVVRNFGLGQPIEAPELGAGFGGDDHTFYLAVDEITSSELGAFLWIPREDFAVKYYGPQTEAQLDRLNELEWHTQGRYGLMAGHPFLLFKCTT